MEVPAFQLDHLPQKSVLALGSFYYLFLHPQKQQNKYFFVKVIEMERNYLNACGYFSLMGLMGVEYDSNSWATEGFDLVAVKPQCKMASQWTVPSLDRGHPEQGARGV